MASHPLVLRGPVSPRVPHRRLFAWFVVLLAAVLSLLVFASPFVVEHWSMESTLRPGDVLLVDRISPHVIGVERGAVVVFEPPIRGYQGEPFVKRVIGLPGDLVEIRGGAVAVNGAPLQEPYVYDGQPTTTGMDDVTVRVPAGFVFVLGDHRADSWDSRGYGPVPLANVIGRAWLAYDPGTAVALLPSAQYAQAASQNH